MALDRIEQMNWTVAGGALATSAVFAPRPFTLSLAVGVMLEAINYRALRRSTAFLFDGRIHSGPAWSVGFSFRFVFLAIAMGLAIWLGAHPIGLLLGLSTIVPAVVIAALREPTDVDPVPPTQVPPPDDPSWDEWDPWRATYRDAEDDDS